MKKMNTAILCGLSAAALLALATGCETTKGVAEGTGRTAEGVAGGVYDAGKGAVEGAGKIVDGTVEGAGKVVEGVDRDLKGGDGGGN